MYNKVTELDIAKLRDIVGEAHVLTGEAINPMDIDEDRFYALLQEKIQQSTFKKETSAQTLNTENTY